MNTTEQIRANGWAGPVRILSEEALEALRHHLKELDLRKDAAWSKDLAVRDRVIFDLAQHPTLLSVITPLLGENIVLWGAQVVQRTPGQAHAWHSDLEVWDARAEDAVSVWIGLEGTSDESSLHFISGTQTLGIPFKKPARTSRGTSAPAKRCSNWRINTCRMLSCASRDAGMAMLLSSPVALGTAH
jgi:hypothetical protein